MRICALCVIGALVCVFFRKLLPCYAPLVTLSSALVILFLCLHALEPAVVWLKTLTDETGLMTYAAVMLRVTGIGILTNIAAELCRDAGENGMASGAELAGKAAILVCALPVMQSLMSEIRGFLV